MKTSAKQQAMKDILAYVAKQRKTKSLPKGTSTDTWIVSVSHFNLKFNINL